LVAVEVDIGDSPAYHSSGCDYEIEARTWLI